MSLLFLPLPFFLAFELWQLVVAERYLGIKQIESGVDPRRLPLSSGRASLWTLGIVAGWLWSFCLLFDHLSRDPGAAMLLTSVGGLVLRRVLSLKWILVSLTLEGAVRIGMMAYLALHLYRHLV